MSDNPLRFLPLSVHAHSGLNVLDVDGWHFCAADSKERAEAIVEWGNAYPDLLAKLAQMREAHDEVRDAILHERHGLAESGIQPEQINDVLGVLDDAFHTALSTPPAPDKRDEQIRVLREALRKLAFDVNGFAQELTRYTALDVVRREMWLKARNALAALSTEPDLPGGELSAAPAGYRWFSPTENGLDAPTGTLLLHEGDGRWCVYNGEALVADYHYAIPSATPSPSLGMQGQGKADV